MLSGVRRSAGALGLPPSLLNQVPPASEDALSPGSSAVEPDLLNTSQDITIGRQR